MKSPQTMFALAEGRVRGVALGHCGALTMASLTTMPSPIALLGEATLANDTSWHRAFTYTAPVQHDFLL